MTFQISPLTAEDLQELQRSPQNHQGTLSAAAADICFHASTEDEIALRTEWSLQQQYDQITTDRTANMVKAQDPETGTIVGLARWHYYEKGYDQLDLEYAGLRPKNDDSSYPPGMDSTLYKALLDSFFLSRRSWMGDGPYWGKCRWSTEAGNERCRG